ncbi:outer membrane beta-barrel family protein [Pedobacter sp. MC2016-05]|uniref:outer membrane beta-barrel family protein n=1 Tax=Pedobacter sp. MC2016-05 TaxID=2994474 RepID=UPI002245EBD1|nr:outer membrane beta-barrel family protein [Pedobacter sp. MC2016-05]MCX2477127.1 outer membrane beta-barrel family protein [Pedobacter sp. MC2016-05]
MKKLLVLMACLMVCGVSFAQNFNKITGKIVDEKEAALPFAIIRVMNFADTSVVKSVSSNQDGDYEITLLKSGSYLLSVSIVGYKSLKTDRILLTADLKMPNIKLEGLTKQLKEVSISGKKPFIEHQIDKTVLNVENSITSTGGTALDVLEKAPGVQIDRQSEQIKLNNKSGVLIMIDGKTNFLSGADVTALLSNMSAEQISTIELITNPSSKYDAAGNAGIINIKLKRNKAYGTNGTISFNGGQGLMPNSPTDLYRAGVNLNLNHRQGKWNVFGNGAMARKSNFNNTFLNRTTLANGLASSLTQNFDRKNKGLGFQGKLGTDYYASEKTVFGVMLDANTVKTKLTNFSNTNINAMQNGISTLSAILQDAYSTSPASNLTANFNIKHDFDKNGKSLTFDMDYSGFSNEKEEIFLANYLNANGNSDNKTTLRNTTDAKINVYAAKTDLTLPLSKTMKIETGLKSSYVVTNNDFLSEQFSSGVWQNDLGKSNNFVYKENINAAYANFSKEWKVWQIQLGLRAEHTHSNGNSITDNKEVERNYLSLFPTAFVNQKISEKHNIRYSYSRRVDRPNYQQLNPFVFYMDPLALDQGNPYLKPQFTNSFEINYSYKEASLTLGYSDTRDMITQISQQNDETRVISVIRQNLGRFQNFSAGVYVPIKIAKWWNMQNNASVYYSKFEDGNLEGGAYSAGQAAVNLYSSSSFTLPQNFSIEINFWLNTPRVSGVERTTVTQYAFNAGIQKSVLNKKLKLRLNMDDIFLTNYWAGSLIYQNVNMTVTNRYTSRRANFSISYGFGNQNVKSARSRNTATEDIKNRAGS